MALFDLRKYDLQLKVDKPNDKNEYYLGDKVKGKVELEIRKPFIGKNLILSLIKESTIKTKSKLDNKETVKTEKEFLYNDILKAQHNYTVDEDSQKYYDWPFQILISKNANNVDRNLLQRYFDAFYPAEIKTKYYIEVSFDLPWPHDKEVIKKDLIIKERY